MVIPSFAQLNMTYISNLSYDIDVNDIWGYAAPDGTEYALVGTVDGLSIVSLADPVNPIEVDFIAGQNTTWRDIKTWSTFAYVTNESGGGLAVVDLTNLPNSTTSYYWTPDVFGEGNLSACHNIFIDEFGYGYLAGCNFGPQQPLINGGGNLFVDFFTDPANPVLVGKTPPRYSHDAYARDNILYSSDINDGFFTIYDVTDKSNPIELATQATDFNFTHNSWLSDDGNYLFTTDELANAPIGSYDVSDLNNIKELDLFVPSETLGEGVIPHNVHVWGDWLIISYYTDGCIIVDASRPDNLVEVGNFDTYIPESTGFFGAWGAYPFLPSGLVLVSDIENGLYVLEPNYVNACWLEGKVTDATNGNPIFNANVTISSTSTFDLSNLQGDYKTGYAESGTFEIEFFEPTYIPKTVPATLVNGEVTILDVELEPAPTYVFSGVLTDIETGNPIENGVVRVTNEFFNYEIMTDANGNFSIPDFYEGTYEIYAGKWGYKTNIVDNFGFTPDNNSVAVGIEKGIEDVFLLDLGWTVEGSAFAGVWELGQPNGIFLNFGPFANFVTPNEDVATDIGNGHYRTGISDQFQDGVFGGSTTLTSPVIDMSTWNDPYISFHTWFLSSTLQGGATTDQLIVKISNGTEEVELQAFDSGSIFGIDWSPSEFRVSDFITPSSTVQVSFEVTNNENDEFTDGSIDYFQAYDAMSTSNENIFFTKDLDLIARPNPSSDLFVINYTMNTNNGATLKVYNSIGQIVKTIDLVDSVGKVIIEDELLPGVYFAQILNGDEESKTIRLLKQK